jgi:hypothetical protein
MLVGFLKLGATLALIAALGPLGPSWACAGVALAGGVALAANLLVAHREGVSVSRFTGGMLRAVAACVPMYVVVAMVRAALEHVAAGGTPVSLAAEIFAGAIAYAAAALLVARPGVNDLAGLVRQLIARRVSRVAPTTESSA